MLFGGEAVGKLPVHPLGERVDELVVEKVGGAWVLLSSLFCDTGILLVVHDLWPPYPASRDAARCSLLRASAGRAACGPGCLICAAEAACSGAAVCCWVSPDF